MKPSIDRDLIFILAEVAVAAGFAGIAAAIGKRSTDIACRDVRRVVDVGVWTVVLPPPRSDPGNHARDEARCPNRDIPRPERPFMSVERLERWGRRSHGERVACGSRAPRSRRCDRSRTRIWLGMELVGWSVLAVVLTGCITAGPQTFEESADIRRDATFAIGAIENRTPTTDIDVADLLREALEDALHDKGVLASDSADYVLELEIVEYEPGNAFKRWLLPGFGSTILGVGGRITDRGSGATVSRIDHRRAVYAGGAYSIGAWKGIFGSVASDIARDLSRRAARKGFTVSLRPWSDHAVEIPVAIPRRQLIVAPVRDVRAERGRIGERSAAFGVSMGDVYLGRDVPEYMREVVSDDLRGAGHKLEGQDQDAEVQVTLDRFWTHTETTSMYWDVVGEIQIRVSLGNGPESEPISCQATQRTYVWPGEQLVADVLDECLATLMERFRKDPIWND